MQGLQAAMSQLKSSSEKLVNSKLALASLQRAAEGTRMLVSITSSLYVPGETTQLSNVLIDVGTGYYIEKSGPEAQAFLDRKIHLITGQAYKVAQAMQIKQESLQGTVRAMNSKITEYQQQQKQIAMNRILLVPMKQKLHLVQQHQLKLKY